MSDQWGIDSHKLHLHPAWAAQWLAADTWEKAKSIPPIYWEITTSAACNHRCTFCSTDAIGYPAILMDTATLSERMVEAAALGVKSVMFGGTGEPLVHKKISHLNNAAVLVAGLDTAFTTNGVLLDKLDPIDICSWIKVSLNAGTKESYAAIHRTDAGDWDKVWAAIRNAVKRKGDCTLGVQCVVLPENVYDLKALAALCIYAGVDYLVLKPYTQATFMLSHKYENTDYAAMRAFLAEVEAMSTKDFKVIYRRNAINEEIGKQHAYDKCRATPSAWVYSMADGRVFTCSAHLLDDRFCIGNLNDNTFQEIWEGEKREANWHLMREEFDIKQCRLNCRMNGPNKYLHQLTHQVHANFI